MSIRVKNILKLAASIIGCLGAGLIGLFFTSKSIPIWYSTLQKPPFTPPDWLFAPVWTVLYLLLGVSAFIVWRRGLDGR